MDDAGHILAGTIKDVITRYWHANGRYVERRRGPTCTLARQHSATRLSYLNWHAWLSSVARPQLQAANTCRQPKSEWDTITCTHAVMLARECA
jgi:hypothetical protein